MFLYKILMILLQSIIRGFYSNLSSLYHLRNLNFSLSFYSLSVDSNQLITALQCTFFRCWGIVEYLKVDIDLWSQWNYFHSYLKFVLLCIFICTNFVVNRNSCSSFERTNWHFSSPIYKPLTVSCYVSCAVTKFYQQDQRPYLHIPVQYRDRDTKELHRQYWFRWGSSHPWRVLHCLMLLSCPWNIIIYLLSCIKWKIWSTSARQNQSSSTEL